MTRPRAALALLFLFAGCTDPARGGRTAVRVVGSSTVFPFTAAVAERFVRRYPDAPAPVVESTGTGGGMRLFCAGVGPAYPDLEDASRRMEPAEYRDCAANGAGRLLEVEIGRDGVAFVRARAGADLPLTAALLYRALVSPPPGRPAARSWRDLDPALPATPIRVYGPPSTSGTRSVVAGLVLRRGCALVDPGRDPADCTRLREDGGYIDSGENDNVVVGKLRADPAAIGIVGFGYLRENAATIAGLAIDGVQPTEATIAGGSYPVARPLYLYVKAAHLEAVPRLRELLGVYADSWAPGGPLARHGLIPAPAVVRARSAAVIAGALPLDPATLGR